MYQSVFYFYAQTAIPALTGLLLDLEMQTKSGALSDNFDSDLNYLLDQSFLMIEQMKLKL